MTSHNPHSTPFSIPDASSIPAPLDVVYSASELERYNGTDPTLPIYVAIKQNIYDVSAKRDFYGIGGSYNVFAGKDASRGLGKSSLKVEDAVSDYSTLSETEVPLRLR